MTLSNKIKGLDNVINKVMMGESEWIHDYFMSHFNFGFNHKCVCEKR